MRKIISIFVLVAFLGILIKSPADAQMAQEDFIPYLPIPGEIVHLSPEYTPAFLKGMVIHPENALKFDFIVNKGDKLLTEEQKRKEYTKLTKYFLASLAIPDEDQWVNLSPYEKDRIIKDDFGKTEMGRDLLAQDYILKQITASLIYPEDNLGKKFWDKVYTQAREQFGTANIPVNTFNKVWILPDDALIYEKGNTAYVIKNHLKVMLEEDYLSLQKHSGVDTAPAALATRNDMASIGANIVREIVLPELEKEVNEGKNFANLRQVYSGMLLAAWYKRALKESLLSKIYANKAKIKGVDQDPKNNEWIYSQYLKAYKKGVFNFIKEDFNKYTNETIPRKYFSGGAVDYAQSSIDLGHDPLKITENLDHAQLIAMQKELQGNNFDYARVAAEEKAVVDAAQLSRKEMKSILNPRYREESKRKFGKLAVIVSMVTIISVYASLYEFFPKVIKFARENIYSPSSTYSFLVQETNSEMRSPNPNMSIVDKDIWELTKLVEKGQPNMYVINNPALVDSLRDKLRSKKDRNAQLAKESLISLAEAGNIYAGMVLKGHGVNTSEYLTHDRELVLELQECIDRLSGIFETKKSLVDSFDKERALTDISALMYTVQNNPDSQFKDKARSVLVDLRNRLNVIAQGESISQVAQANELLASFKDFNADPLPKADQSDGKTLVPAQTVKAPISSKPSGNNLHKRWIKQPNKRNGAHMALIKDFWNGGHNKDHAQSIGLVKMTFLGFLTLQGGIQLFGLDGVHQRPNFSSSFSGAFKNSPWKNTKNTQIINMMEILRIKDGLLITNLNDKQLMLFLNGLTFKEADVLGKDGFEVDFKGEMIVKYVPEDNTVVTLGKGISYSPLSGLIFSDPYGRLILSETKDGLQLIRKVKISPSIQISPRNSGDKAQINGGIDFNSAHLDLQIKRDGKGVPLPVSQQDLASIHIDGLVPVILDITPAMDMPLLAQLQSSHS